MTKDFLNRFVGLLALELILLGMFTQNSQGVLFEPAAIAGHLSAYDTEEKRLIEKDLTIVEQVCFDSLSLPQEPGKKKFYVATCGAPGSRKSTILERFLCDFSAKNNAFAYLDPDQRALKFMAHTYQARSLNAATVAQHADYTIVTKQAYEKWRAASNYITLRLLEKAFDAGYNIVHGTTSTGPLAPVIVSACKKAGYEIVFLLCNSQDSFRGETIAYRNQEQKFYQSTPEDAMSKGFAFPPRIKFFFEFGDELYLYWSSSLEKAEQLAATFSQGNENIVDADAYKDFVAKYELDAKLLKEQQNIDLLAWPELVSLYKIRFQEKN